MPSTALAELTKEVKDGFAALTAAVTGQGDVDLAPLITQVTRVADALYVEGEDESVANLMATANDQVTSVIGADSAGDQRVRINPDMPT